MESSTDAREPNDGLARLQALREEHRLLDERIRDLSAKPWLSPDDQIEIARLKKLKLRKKDEIFTMTESLGIEP